MPLDHAVLRLNFFQRILYSDVVDEEEMMISQYLHVKELKTIELKLTWFINLQF